MFGLDFIKKLKPCKWRYKDHLDDGLEHFGFIAQEVNALASHKDYAFVEYGADGIYRLRLGEFIGPIVKALQEVDERLNRLEKILMADRGKIARNNVGHDQTCGDDTLGPGHDLAPDLGDLRRTEKAA
jgi:hypothetical protein